MKEIEIIDITPDNVLDYGVCGYKNPKKEGFPEKVSWIKQNYSNGLRIKSILTMKDGIQGMIEYIPGEYCWRPVEANGYIFIHCLFAGFKNKYKNKGFASELIDICMKDAQEQNKYGVVVVTRKGSFMVGSQIFLKKNFEIIDTAEPDFELLAIKFEKNFPSPKFKGDWNKKLSKYNKGLFIIRADQCPYTVKNVNEIVEVSKKNYGLIPKVIKHSDHNAAQKSACAFGTFSIIYNGEILSYHPISSTRFINIMNSILN